MAKTNIDVGFATGDRIQIVKNYISPIWAGSKGTVLSVNSVLGGCKILIMVEPDGWDQEGVPLPLLLSELTKIPKEPHD
jgi:hypothetical protein